jgi:hypothetical protein
MPPFVLMSDALRDGDILATDWSTASVNQDYADIVLITPNGDKRLLVRGGYQARYVAPGYLLFGRSGDLFASRFDLATRAVIGEPAAVATGVSMDSLFSVLHASVSSNGIIAYVPGTNRSIGRLAWVDHLRLVVARWAYTCGQRRGPGRASAPAHRTGPASGQNHDSERRAVGRRLFSGWPLARLPLDVHANSDPTRFAVGSAADRVRNRLHRHPRSVVRHFSRR